MVTLLYSNGRTVLMAACFYDEKQMVSQLIENQSDVNVNEQDNKGESALMVACTHGHVEIVEELIKKQCNLELQNKYGKSALMKACAHGYGDVVQQLIKKQCNLELQDASGTNALMQACFNGHEQIVTQLVQKKCNLDVQAVGGVTALIYACMSGQPSQGGIVAQLIEKKCDVNILTSSDSSALMFACRKGHEEVVLRLLDAHCFTFLGCKRALLSHVKTDFGEISNQLNHVIICSILSQGGFPFQNGEIRNILEHVKSYFTNETEKVQNVKKILRKFFPTMICVETIGFIWNEKMMGKVLSIT